MKKNIKILIFAVVLIMAAILALIGGMHIIAWGDGESDDYYLDAMTGVSGENDTILSQEQMMEKFSKMAQVDTSANTVTVITKEYLNSYWKSNYEKKRIRSLATEEVLFLIQDSISLYRQYDQIVLPGFAPDTAQEEVAQRFPSVEEKIYTKEERSYEEDVAIIRQIVWHRITLLSSPDAFSEEEEEVCYFPDCTARTDKDNANAWFTASDNYSHIFLRKKTGSEKVYPTVEMMCAELESMGLPYMEEDWFELLTDGLNGTVYLDESGTDALHLVLVAGSNLGESISWTDAYLSTDTGARRSLENGKYWNICSVSTDIPYPVFLSWQGISWQALAADGETYAEELAKYAQGYKLVEQASVFQPLYKEQMLSASMIVLEIPFEDLGVPIKEMRRQYAAGREVESVYIKKLSMTFGGVTKEYEVDLEFRGTYCGDAPSQDIPLLSGNGLMNGTYAVGTTGVGSVTLYQETGDQEVTLKKVTLIGGAEGEEHLGSTLYYSANEQTPWDGNSPLTVPANEHFRLTFKASYPDLKWKLSANRICYFLLEYSCAGEDYKIAVRSEIYTTPNPFAVYAQTAKGIDIESYYRDYYLKVEDPIQNPKDHMEGWQ